MKQLLLLFLLPLVFFSCKKDSNGPSSSKGRVLDGVTNEPLSAATVFLLRKPAGGFNYQQVSYTFSDQNGTYNLSYEAEKGYSYALAAKRFNYRDGSYQSISSGEAIDKDLYLEPKGWLKFTFVNAPPLDTVEYISVAFAYDPHFNVYDTVSTIYEGWGGRMTPVSYFITRNGIKTNYQEEFFCAAHDTTTHYIYY